MTSFGNALPLQELQEKLGLASCSTNKKSFGKTAYKIQKTKSIFHLVLNPGCDALICLMSSVSYPIWMSAYGVWWAGIVPFSQKVKSSHVNQTVFFCLRFIWFPKVTLLHRLFRIFPLPPKQCHSSSSWSRIFQSTLPPPRCSCWGDSSDSLNRN